MGSIYEKTLFGIIFNQLFFCVTVYTRILFMPELFQKSVLTETFNMFENQS